jgi:electron transfer flavoprotein alpha subunit
MSVLVYIENSEGKFKKSAFEVISYANWIAKNLNVPLTAISIGNVADDELKKTGEYGVSLVLNVNDPELVPINSQPYSTAIAAAAKKVNANLIVMTAGFTGKSIAPRVAVKLDAGLGENVIDLPDMSSSFIVKKNAYSGKAFSYLEILAPVKVLSMLPNSFKVVSNPVDVSIEKFAPEIPDKDFTAGIKETIKSSSKISLPEAELVVSAGRGMKGPENWKMIEELAEVLGAATACSKPVSDAGWRPHSEHVGQTGIAISPNLYIAVGISGAIQHLAGVSSSKVIVVVNKDPEAPFFKAADYGIVGDAFEVVPRLIDAAKTFKASQN